MLTDSSRLDGSLDTRSAIPRVPLDARRLRLAKTAYTTRFFERAKDTRPDGFDLVLGDSVVPKAGDLVLAQVGLIGQHTRLERSTSRKSLLYEGDEIVVAYGGRYAPDQFEAEVPEHLGPTNLAAAGGVAGRVLSFHRRMLPPTELHPAGLIADRHGVVTLGRLAPHRLTQEAQERPTATPPTITVLGTSMNSGKTTTVAAIVRGLTDAGLAVAAGKITGTGAGGDPGLFGDAGAVRVLDFTDFGFPSTYQLPHPTIRALFTCMQAELATCEPDAIVIEVADGLFQTETRRLVADPVFADRVDTVVFAAGEAMGAVAGVEHLSRQGIHVSAVSGLLTAGPLTTREAQQALDVPVLDITQLATGACASTLLPAPSVTAVGAGFAERSVAV